MVRCWPGKHREDTVVFCCILCKILDERERSAIDLVRAPDARLKVAIVEDDPDVVTLLQMMLTGLDFPAMCKRVRMALKA